MFPKCEIALFWYDGVPAIGVCERTWQSDGKNAFAPKPCNFSNRRGIIGKGSHSAAERRYP